MCLLVSMRAILTLSAVILLGFVDSVMATSFGPPRDREVKSPNGQFLLHINAESGRHEVREGSKVLWSFDKDVWHDAYFVSNNGRFVLWVSWRFVQANNVKTDALRVYSSRGVALERTFAELGNPRPYRQDEIGPIGDFWRIWRGEVTRKGEVISIPVEGREKSFEIDLSKIDKLRKGAQDGAGQPATNPERQKTRENDLSQLEKLLRRAEQNSADQPATDPKPKPEGIENPNPESTMRPR